LIVIDIRLKRAPLLRPDALLEGISPKLPRAFDGRDALV
jgi:hypothetical protein